MGEHGCERKRERKMEIEVIEVREKEREWGMEGGGHNTHVYLFDNQTS